MDRLLAGDLRGGIKRIIAWASFLALVFYFIGVGLYFSNITPEHLPTANFMDNFSSAINGIGGLVVGGLGALFGIMLASLGLKTARATETRESYVLVKDMTETALGPFAMVGLAMQKTLRLLNAGLNPYNMVDLRATAAWLALRVELAGDDDEFNKLEALYRKDVVGDTYGKAWRFEQPPFHPLLSFESPESFVGAIVDLRAAIRGVTQKPQSLFYASIEGADGHSTLVELELALSDLETRVRSLAAKDDFGGIVWYVQAAFISWSLIKDGHADAPRPASLAHLWPFFLSSPSHALEIDRFRSLLERVERILPSSETLARRVESMVRLPDRLANAETMPGHFLAAYGRMMDGFRPFTNVDIAAVARPSDWPASENPLDTLWRLAKLKEEREMVTAWGEKVLRGPREAVPPDAPTI